MKYKYGLPWDGEYLYYDGERMTTKEFWQCWLWAIGMASAFTGLMWVLLG